MWQIVEHLQLVDPLLDPLPMMRILDANGGEILRRHARNGGQIVARGDEQLRVLLVLHLEQPVDDELIVALPIHTANGARADGTAARRGERSTNRGARRGYARQVGGGPTRVQAGGAVTRSRARRARRRARRVSARRLG